MAAPRVIGWLLDLIGMVFIVLALATALIGGATLLIGLFRIALR